MKSDLTKQIEFILEIDKLKQINRRSYLINDTRTENTAEHSWHIAVAAMLLAPTKTEIDVFHVVKMLLIHDIVEIDAGDTFLYDETGTAAKEELEKKAADRLFSMLPPHQAHEFRALWDEFEERVTPEAKFARGLDRFMPLLHNYFTKGKTWQEHGITVDRVFKHNRIIGDASEELWQEAQKLINRAVENGYLAESPKESAK